MKKIFILALLLFVVTTFASCNISKNDPQDSFDKEEEVPPEVDGEVVFDIGEKVYVVTDTKTDLSFLEIERLICRAVGEENASLITDDSSAMENEITIGVCNREASVVGYEKLSDIECDSLSIRYGVYSSGKSIAIVYDEVEGLEEQIFSCALRLFEALYIKDNSSIRLRRDEFNFATVEISQLHKQKKSSCFASFGDSFGTKTAEALGKMYSELYTDRLITWLASMYDSNYGGFYYSPSARDNLSVEYNQSNYYLLPDIESSALVISFIENSGMIYEDQSVKDALPSQMCEQLIKFVKEKQSDDGYFYHPQWSKEEVSDPRKEIDLSRGTELLSGLGAAPTYDTPSGIFGDGLYWWGDPSQSVDLTIDVPEKLQDKDSFLSYLESLDVRENTYSAAMEIVALSAKIKAEDRILEAAGADYSLAELLIDYLDAKCYASTGFWASVADFSSVDGFVAMTLVYDIFGAPLPYPTESAISAIAVINSDEKPLSSISVCNAWGSVSGVVCNVEKHRSKSESLEIVGEIRSSLINSGVALIEKTTERLKDFINSDGSFSYSESGSSVTREDMPISLGGIREGDVYSTVMCTTELVDSIFTSFGFTPIPAYCCDDYVEFVSVISENELKYNFAPGDSLKKDGNVNYKIYGFKGQGGEINPMIKIYDTEKYEGEKLQRAILTHIITGKGGISAGLSLDMIDFYLSYNFESSFSYHKAPSESDILSGYINYKITNYTSKASVLRIYNSYEITSVAHMREILTYLILSDDGANANLSISDIDYYIVEWQAHNIMYEKPSIIPIMSAEEVKKRAKDVDLNVDDEYASMYSSILSLYG